MSSLPESEREIARIRAEYARREREVPRDLYSLQRPAVQYYLARLRRALLAALDRWGMFPLDHRVVLDVGCGDGFWLLEFSQWGAAPHHLYGIDLVPHQIELARQKLPTAHLHCGDAEQLPWKDGSFDLVCQLTVFTSVLDCGVKQRMAGEMLRVLKPEGVILWYDFRVNNPRNPNVRGIRAAEIRTLFPGCAVELVSTTLAPPLARCLAPLSWSAALMLESLPFLRTHYVGIMRRQPGA